MEVPKEGNIQRGRELGAWLWSRRTDISSAAAARTAQTAPATTTPPMKLVGMDSASLSVPCAARTWPPAAVPLSPEETAPDSASRRRPAGVAVSPAAEGPAAAASARARPAAYPAAYPEEYPCSNERVVGQPGFADGDAGEVVGSAPAGTWVGEGEGSSGVGEGWAGWGSGAGCPVGAEGGSSWTGEGSG